MALNQHLRPAPMLYMRMKAQASIRMQYAIKRAARPDIAGKMKMDVVMDLYIQTYMRVLRAWMLVRMHACMYVGATCACHSDKNDMR